MTGLPQALVADLARIWEGSLIRQLIHIMARDAGEALHAIASAASMLMFLGFIATVCLALGHDAAARSSNGKNGTFAATTAEARTDG